MRKVLNKGYLDWEQEELLKSILDVQYLPSVIIIEGMNFDNE